MRAHDHDEPAAVDLVDPARPEQAIAAATAACSNWGRWGSDDAHGTLNFLTDDKRVEGAGLVRRGVCFSLAQPFEANGPQTGWRRRTNPVHTMLDTGLDAARGTQGFPHGFGGADDVVFMPLQCSTQWDGLGHIFDHGQAWNGRNAADVVTSEGDKVTGIETAAALIAGRAVLLDAGRVLGRDGELPDGFAITPGHLKTIITAHGVSVGRGDIVLVRTGQLAERVRARLPAAAPGGHPAHRPVHRRDVGSGDPGRGLRGRRTVRVLAHRRADSRHRRGRRTGQPDRRQVASNRGACHA